MLESTFKLSPLPRSSPGFNPMHHFAYRDGVLHAEDVSLARIAAEVGTPFYCYSTATLERHYRVLAQAFSGQDALICFAVKANSNQAYKDETADCEWRLRTP